MNYNVEERSKFAKQLLLKVRLNLLSDHCLRYLINDSSLISNNNDCLEVLKSRESFYQNVSTIYNESRQCNQNIFNVLFCGGLNYEERKLVNQVNLLNLNNLKTLKDLPSMLKKRYCFKVVFFKGEAYGFGGLDPKQKPLKSVKKYSPISKTWNYVCDLPDERQDFCACSFIDKIFLFGGYSYESWYTNFCIQLDTKILKWKQMANMNQAKSRAVCAIYEEKIVVSGGYRRGNLNTVESYDVFGNIWTPMPNMIEGRCGHSLICFKSKLFAINGGLWLNIDCEVFDKISNKFVKLETPDFFSYRVKCNLVRSKILVFQNGTHVVLCYDVDKNEWSQESCEATKNIYRYSTVKEPIY